MAYRVDISPSALADAEDAFLWIKERAPERAGDWYNGLVETILSLERFSMRCPLAPESESLGAGVRQILYFKSSRMYRILFGIAGGKEDGQNVVRIFRIWHSARDRIKVAEI